MEDKEIEQIIRDTEDCIGLQRNQWGIAEHDELVLWIVNAYRKLEADKKYRERIATIKRDLKTEKETECSFCYGKGTISDGYDDYECRHCEQDEKEH